MSDEAPAAPYPKLVGRHILVVEDEDLIASVMQEMLVDLGCAKVSVAASVEDALAILRDHRPHAAVLDLNLGGNSGLRLAQVLADAGIPFVFATGYDRHGIADEWISRPILQKPFNLGTLADALVALL